MLTDTKVRSLRPREKPYKVSDERGLYVDVQPSGRKYWRLAYRFNGKQKLLALGVYPDVSLADARRQRDEAKKRLANKIDPSEQRKEQKQAGILNAENTFEAVAREWFAKQSVKWAESHATKIIRRLERDIFPWLGNRPINEIEPPELLKTIERIEQRGVYETAHRALQNAGQVFRYGVVTGRCQRDPSNDLKGALTPVNRNHFSSITEPEDLAKLLVNIKEYKGAYVTCVALKMLPYVFVRPGELRHAEWAEIDFDAKQWIISAPKIKTRIDHIVPLSNQVLELLEDIKPLTGNRQYIFPGARSPLRPMSENALLVAIRNMGYTKEEMTPHGFRATARTILDEVLNYPPHLIEHQLAHAVKDANGRAYNRTKHLPQRREMMEAWADYLDGLCNE